MIGGGAMRFARGTSPSGDTTYDTPGSYTFTVPGGVKALEIELVAGGGATREYTGVGSPAGNGGDGGDAYAVRIVVPGQTVSVVVGAGGAYGYNANPAPSGESSSVATDLWIVSATGGEGCLSTMDGAAGTSSGADGSVTDRYDSGAGATTSMPGTSPPDSTAYPYGGQDGIVVLRWGPTIIA